MSGLDPLWLVIAGFGAGLCGSVAGIASLVSYPALLAVGLSPLAANVTNTVSLVFSSIGSVSGSRPELAGQRQLARRLVPTALLGGACGALLLLATPPGVFAKTVPFLIGFASLAILVRREPSAAALEHGGRRLAPWPLVAAVFVVAVYSGYFGAGAGVVVLALLLSMSGENLARSAALKNLLGGLANLVAAVAFAIDGPVHWLAVPPLAAGLLAGGRLGPVIIRRTPDRPLRAVIACAGIGLAVHLGLGAFGS